MDRVFEWFDGALGLSLKAEQLDFGHMALRALLMYALLLAIVRMGKKRFLGRATAFDVVLIIMIGSVAARGLTGGAPFFPATLAVAVLVATHWLISWCARRSPSLSRIVKGHDTLLVRNGSVIETNLSDAHMSSDDLNDDLREKGIADVTGVSEARLERSGRLSVIKSSVEGRRLCPTGLLMASI
jgi:uncharacterized membrane protein YcaP (DUF421 family)